MYCQEPAPDNMVADLGEVFYVTVSTNAPLLLRQSQPDRVRAGAIRAEHDFTADQVRAVELDVPANRVDHFLNQVPTAADEQPKFLFTIPYAIANAIVRGRPELAHYVAPATHDPQVLDLAGRVTLLPQPARRQQPGEPATDHPDGRADPQGTAAPPRMAAQPDPDRADRGQVLAECPLLRDGDPGAGRPGARHWSRTWRTCLMPPNSLPRCP